VARGAARACVGGRNLNPIDHGLQLGQPLELHVEISPLVGDACLELLEAAF
jgi:hypothetical protein